MFDIEKYLKKNNIPYEKDQYLSGETFYEISADDFKYNKYIAIDRYINYSRIFRIMDYKSYYRHKTFSENVNFLTDLFFITLKELLNGGADEISAQNIAKRKQYNYAIENDCINAYNHIYS